MFKKTGRERDLANLVTIERGLGPEGRIAVVRFDRGDGINALSPEALRQLTDAARSFEDDGDTSVVVLTGGANAFSAGFDLKDAEGRSRRTMDIGALRRHLELGPRLSRAWQEMEQITIGAIEGFASAVASRWRWRWIFASWPATPICECRRSGSA